MKTKFIEAMHVGGTGNWGKFMVARFDAEEMKRPSVVEAEYLAQHPEINTLPGRSAPLLRGRWQERNVLVYDIQTGEGARFSASPGGHGADLEKHRIWVCPLFQPFLAWLYQQDLTDLDKLPAKIEFTEEEVQSEFRGYRRPGPTFDTDERALISFALGGYKVAAQERGQLSDGLSLRIFEVLSKLQDMAAGGNSP